MYRYGTHSSATSQSLLQPRSQSQEQCEQFHLLPCNPIVTTKKTQSHSVNGPLDGFFLEKLESMALGLGPTNLGPGERCSGIWLIHNIVSTCYKIISCLRHMYHDR